MLLSSAEKDNNVAFNANIMQISLHMYALTVIIIMSIIFLIVNLVYYDKTA